jgi:ABC-type multidrug transport system permease subunit
VLPYFVSKLVADLPVLIAGPILFSVSSYWMVGLISSANDFFAFLGALWLISWVMSSLGLFISAANRSFQAAVAIGNVTLVFTMLYAGFLINPKTIPDYFIWLHYMSPIKYGFAIIANTQYADLQIKCVSPENCLFHNGTEVLDYLRVKVDTYASVLVMIGQVLLIYVMTYLALRFLNKRR